MQAHLERVQPQLVAQTVQRGDFVGAALDQMRDAKLAHARGGGRRAASAEHRDTDARAGQQLDAVPVAHVKYLVRFAARTEDQPPVGEHAVASMIEHQKARCARPLAGSGGARPHALDHRRRRWRVQTTPARIRS